MPCPESAAAEGAPDAHSAIGDSAQSSAVAETEVVSAETDPASDEFIVPVTSEEASSATPAEISASQTPPRSGIVTTHLCLLVSVYISFVTIAQRFFRPVPPLRFRTNGTLAVGRDL